MPIIRETFTNQTSIHSLIEGEEFILLKKWLAKLKKSKIPGESSENTSKGKKHKRLLLPLLGAVIVLCVLGGVGMATTSSDKFCTSCHEMSPEAATTKVTSHANVSCVSCHQGQGIGNFLKYKVKIASFIFKHYTGQVPDQIVTTSPIPTPVCEGCHSTNRVVTATGDINIPHDKHLKQGVTCTACHGGVTHANIAERGLTKKADQGSWTAAKAESVTKLDASKTTMEACLDCHEQVNAGKKPWLENQGLGKSEKQRVAENEALAKKAATSDGKLAPAVTVSAPVKSDLQAPIRCAPCHKAIKTPNSHVDQAWGTIHGVVAAQDVRYCASCHSRERERVLLTAQTTVQDYARNNTLCAPCHEKRPPGHLTNQQQWLPTHSTVVKAKKPDGCLVCHEVAKIDPAAPVKKLPGVNAVTCNTCHWFKNGQVTY